LPRPVSPNEQHGETGEHDALAETARDIAGEQYEVIGGAGLSVSKSATQPVTGGLLRRHPHGMRLAEPAAGKIGDVEDRKPRTSAMGRSHAVEDFAGSVGGSVINGNDFVVGIIEREHGGE